MTDAFALLPEQSVPLTLQPGILAGEREGDADPDRRRGRQAQGRGKPPIDLRRVPPYWLGGRGRRRCHRHARMVLGSRTREQAGLLSWLHGLQLLAPPGRLVRLLPGVV